MRARKAPQEKSSALRPVTRATYLATLDACAKAVALEAEKAAANDPAAMARWAEVAVPRYRELHAVLDQAEREDWGRATVWWAEWRERRP